MKNKLTTLSFLAPDQPDGSLAGHSLAPAVVLKTLGVPIRGYWGGAPGTSGDFQIFWGHLNSLLEGGRMLLEQRAEI